MIKKFRWQVAQLFEKFWWKNYLKNKNAFQYLSWKTNYWMSFIEDIQFSLEYSQNSNLDIGCGPAGTFILSKQTNTSWVALDPLLDNYENLEIFNKQMYPNVEFVHSSFEDFKNKKKFKSIFCINAINHFKDLKTNFKKLHSLLEDDGTLILSTDTHNYSTLKWILYTLPLDILHPHQYTDKEYENFIIDNGFEIISKTLNKKEFIFSYYVYILKKQTTQ